MLTRTGRFLARHPRSGIAAWLAVVLLSAAFALFGAGGASLFDRLESGIANVERESQEGRRLIRPDGEDPDAVRQVLLLATGVDLNDPVRLRAAAEATASAARDLDGVPGVVGVDDPLPALAAAAQSARTGIPGPAQAQELLARAAPALAEGNTGFLLTVKLDTALLQAKGSTVLDDATGRLEQAGAAITAASPGARTDVGGAPVALREFSEITERDLVKAEAVSLPIALLVMVVVFGGLLAAGIPLMIALATIVTALGGIYAATYFFTVDTMVVNTISIMGLGLSIDYGLLMVSRFREEYRALGALPDAAPRWVRRERLVRAVGGTVGTAGRTVVFSGLTVALSIGGLLFFTPTLIRSIAFGGALAVLLALATSVVLLPSLLGVFGERLLRPSPLVRVPGLSGVLGRFGDVAPAEGVFSRLTRWVQRRAGIVLAGCLAALLLLGSPALGMRFSNSNLESLPSSSPSRAFFQVLEKDFPNVSEPSVAVVADTSPAELDRALAGIPRLADTAEPAAAVEVNGLALARLEPKQDDASTGAEAVRLIREHRPAGFDTWVTGRDADYVDFMDSVAEDAPKTALFIAVSTVVLLFLLTGSVVIPLKALVMSVLSLGASVGVLVWGFQQGHLAGLLGFNAADVTGVDTLVVVFVLVFGFGLAMDYEMFLLSRVKEHHDAHGDNRAAVVHGMQRSGRIITSAAVIIVVVFAGFTTGGLLQLKQIGVALSVAVLLDATVVRCLFVPATMTLLGEKWNWWAPAWLARLHRRVGLRD